MMRFQSRALLAALLLCVSPAAAQQEPLAAPDAESTDPADVLFRQANDLYKKQQYEEAEAAYERAFALKKAYDIATNLAYAETNVGQFEQAAEHLSFALKSWPPTGKDQERKRIAIERLASLKQELTTLKIHVNVEGAEIFVNRRPVGRSPLAQEVFVEPRSTTVEAKLSGYADARQVIAAVRATEQTVALELVAAPPLQATPSESKPAATVASRVEKKEEPQPQSSTAAVRKIVIGAGIVTSALLVGTGATFTIWSNQTASEADALRESLQRDAGPNGCSTPGQFATACNKLRALGEDQSRDADVALWTFVAGGAAAVGTLVYAIVSRNKPNQATVQIFPSVHTGSTTLIVRGQW